ncbi:unnamed protein product [Parajaminaea phylloscopi]
MMEAQIVSTSADVTSGEGVLASAAHATPQHSMMGPSGHQWSSKPEQEEREQAGRRLWARQREEREQVAVEERRRKELRVRRGREAEQIRAWWNGAMARWEPIKPHRPKQAAEFERLRVLEAEAERATELRHQKQEDFLQRRSQLHEPQWREKPRHCLVGAFAPTLLAVKDRRRQRDGRRAEARRHFLREARQAL